MKSFREMADQFAELRRAKRAQPPPANAKTERNAEIVWMHSVGVPVSHIARIHGITPIRVRDIVKRAARSAAR